MRDGDERRCVRCDFDPGYNRLVLDLVRDVEVGPLCRSCELDAVPTLTVEDHPSAHESGSSTVGCACPGCDRDPTYALARWLPSATIDRDDVTFQVDHELDENPLELCDEHYHELISGGVLTSADRVAPTDRR